MEEDFSANAKELGLIVTKEGVEARLLGRDYLITSQGVFPKDGQKADPNCLSLLVHYSLSQGRGEPGEDFLSLSQLPGVMRGQRDLETDILNLKMEKAFGEGDDEFFATAAAKLGGIFLGEHKAGGKLWLFKILPKINLEVVYSEADEEFPLEIRVLFSSRAPEFMKFECLGFLSACLVEALVEASGKKP
jgi:hypothetical protein